MTSTLDTLAVRSSARVRSLLEPLQTEFQRRLRELGFREGSRVTCLRRTPLGGPRVYEVDGAVFSLEASLARHIEVEGP